MTKTINHTLEVDIINQLKVLGCQRLVLGEYKAIVGKYGFVINWFNLDGSKGEKRWKEGDEISITEILDENYFNSGDLVFGFRAHKDFFKGIVKHKK